MGGAPDLAGRQPRIYPFSTVFQKTSKTPHDAPKGASAHREPSNTLLREGKGDLYLFAFFFLEQLAGTWEHPTALENPRLPNTSFHRTARLDLPWPNPSFLICFGYGYRPDEKGRETARRVEHRGGTGELGNMASRAADVLEAIIRRPGLGGSCEPFAATHALAWLVDSAPPELLLALILIGIVWLLAVVCASGALCVHWGVTRGPSLFLRLRGERPAGGQSIGLAFGLEETARELGRQVHDGSLIVGNAPSNTALGSAPQLGALTDQDGGAAPTPPRRRNARMPA